MKRFLAGLLAVFVICTAAVPAYAAEDDGDGGWGIDFSFLTDWLEDWLPETEIEEPEEVDKQVDDLVHSANVTFDAIKGFLLKSDENYLFINGPAITAVLSKVFLPIGYIVFLVCWSIGVAQNAVALELWDVNRGIFVRVLTTLLAGVLLMGISTQILQLLSELAQAWTAEVITVTEMNLEEVLPKSKLEEFKSDVPIVGAIIQIINYFMHIIPVLFYNCFVLVCSIIMAVSLGIRVIKMAIYQGVAPVFFGLIGSNSTAVYFRNFIVQYCSICFQLVIMAAIFSAFQITYVSHLATISSDNFQLSSFLMGGIVMLVFCVMMVKSDRLFDRVFR